jgi:hypothetical protein
MTVNRRMVRSLRDVRLCLRELALAEHAAVSDSEMRAEEILAAANHDLEGTLAGAPAAMSAASSIAELDRISQMVAAHHVCLDEASGGYAAAVALTEAAYAVLRDRTRQARSAERLVERFDRESARRESAQEQRSHDDQHRRSTTRDPKSR